MLGREPPPLDRANCYLAVMVDDLTLHGVSEPYRMLTARAEYRLRLRANNALTRLTPLAIAAGLCRGRNGTPGLRREDERARSWEQRWSPGLRQRTGAAGLPLRRDGGRRRLREWLRFPDINCPRSPRCCREACDPASELADELAEDAAYAPYLARQEAELRDLRRSEARGLGGGFPFAEVPGLSNEMVERLVRLRGPPTLAAAGRVRGITPAALAALLVHARRRSVHDGTGTKLQPAPSAPSAVMWRRWIGSTGFAGDAG